MPACLLAEKWLLPFRPLARSLVRTLYSKVNLLLPDLLQLEAHASVQMQPCQTLVQAVGKQPKAPRFRVDFFRVSVRYPFVAVPTGCGARLGPQRQGLSNGYDKAGSREKARP